MPDKITDRQLQLLQTLYSRRRAEGLLAGPAGQQYAGDEREQRIEWARAHLGKRALVSFSDLTITEAAYLIDIVSGNPTKLDRKLQALFTEREIVDPAAWFETYQTKAQMWKFRGSALHELNRWQKIRLVNVLMSRSDLGASRPPMRQPAPQKPATTLF